MQGRGRFTIGVVTLMLGGVAAANASAAVLTVTTTQDERTAGDQQCSLREAIAAVNTPGTLGDCAMADDVSNTIVLGAHAYVLQIHPAGADDQSTGDLDVTGVTPLTIEGAGANLTSINASGLQDRVMQVLANTTVTIRGLTVTGGHAPNGAAGLNGQQIPVEVKPTAGQAGSPGGGILNGGTLTLEDTAVTSNTAGSGGQGGSGEANTSKPDADGKAGGGAGKGGGIANIGSGSLTLTNVTVSGNFAGDGGNGGAGGVGATLSPVGGTGGDGGCCGDGGGLYNNSGHVTVTGSTFSGNHAGAGGSGGAGQSPGGSSGIGGAGGSGQGGSSGGAIATTGAGPTVTITNSTLSGNVSGVGGNGGHGGTTTANPISPYTSGGNAGNGSAGGGLFVSGGATVTLTNATVDGNLVGDPGTPGAAGTHPPCTGPNCGLPQPGTAGSAALGGGVYDSTTPAVTLADTLLASNELGNCAGNIADGAHNLSFGVSAGCPAGFAHGDPKLGPLQDNGGATPTEALGSGSAAIDQGGAACGATDQRGLARPSGAACDIGAYEVTPPVVTTPAASAITATTATLSGAARPNTASANVHFDFGTTASYGSATGTTIVTGLAAQPLSANLTGLVPSTTYHVRLVATSTDGTAHSGDVTFKTSSKPSPPPPTPELSKLKLAHASFHARPKRGNAKGKTGTTITYIDSLAATTTLVVFSQQAGVKHRGKCVRRTKRIHGSKCTIAKRVLTITHRDRAGANRLAFNPRLPPGHYRLQATPHTSSRRGRTVSVSFTVLR